jgi:uncharacterized membrane protein YgcG
MLHRVRHCVGACLFALVILLVASPPDEAGAQTKTLRWHRWDSDIEINADGTFRVREVYEIEFIGGDFTFGFRNIPILQFESLRDFSVSEGGLEYVEAYGEQPNSFYVAQGGGEYVVNWFYPPTRDQTRVFAVEYTVVGGININAEVGDRFLWQAVGPEHDFPVEASTVVVRMPPGATIDTSIEPSYYGVSATYVVSDDLTTVTYQTGPLPAGQAFEVRVRFPHGFIPEAKPSWQEAYDREQMWNESGRPTWNLLLGGLAVLLLVGGVGGIYLLWLMAGRDPSAGTVPSFLSEPPSDLPPGVAGTLVDETADLQDIIATLVDLARRGVIEMEEQEKKFLGLSVSRDFVFRRSAEHEERLRKYEELLLEEMFGGGSEIELEDLQAKFYTAIARIQQALYAESVTEGLFPVSPRAVRGRYLGLGVAGLVLAAGMGFCIGAAVPRPIDALACPFAALGVASIGLMLAARVMPAKTRKGAEEAAKWRAFKTYLKDAERFADLGAVTEQFDKYLPYAIAFGLDKSWIGKFSRIPGTPIPRWYIPMGGHPYVGMPVGEASGGEVMGKALRGGRDLRGEAVRPVPSLDGMSDRVLSGLSGMSGGLIAMLNSTATTFTSVPRSSSGGGGFSGGGFSGGGFSGGGGGGAGFG